MIRCIDLSALDSHDLGMFTEESNKWDRVFFVLVTVAAFGALAWLRLAGGARGPSETVSTPTLEVELAPAQQVPTTPVQVRESSVPRPHPQRARAIAAVFECYRDGQRVLSDQPCGPDAQVRTIDAPNRMQAQDTSNLYEPRVRSYSPPRASRPARTNAGVASRCEWIELEIDRINARMRQKYKDGERLRQRLRELSAERWEIECRFLNTPQGHR